ncbi:hypothetical protein LINPERHAP2_LOCUS9817 [Linum perenne]
MVWHYSKHGKYTVRSAYRVMMEKVNRRTHLNVARDWNKIWSLEIPPKVKHFIWRLGRGVVPTRPTLLGRGI